MLGNITLFGQHSINESDELISLIRLSQNGDHTMQGLSATVPIASLSVLPAVEGAEFGTARGLEICVGSHVLRTWYTGLEVLSRLWNVYFPNIPVEPSIVRRITAALLTHDIGKLSIFDTLVRDTSKFTNEQERRTKVARHTLFPFELMRELILRSTYGTRYSDLNTDDISTLGNIEQRQMINHSMIYSTTLHHIAVENSPTIDYLLEREFITPEIAKLIRNQLYLNKTDPRQALLNMMSNVNSVQGIAIGVSFVTIPDIGDSLLSQTRLYQSNDMDRKAVLKTLLQRAFESQFVDIVHEVICELYADPKVLHQRAMLAFRHYLQNITSTNSKIIVGFDGLLKQNYDCFMRLTRDLDPVDIAAPLYLENGK